MPGASLIKRNILLIGFLCLLIPLLLLLYKDFGVPWDEKIFFEVGRFYLVQVFNALHIPTNLSTEGFTPTPYHVLGHGVFMDMVTVLAGLPFPHFNFETLHLIRAFFSIPIFILAFWIMSKLVSKVYGLIAMVLLLLSPRFFPEIFYNAVDIPTTLLFIASVSFFIYYSQSKQTIFKSVVFGLLLALTVQQRLLLFFLPLLNFVFLGIVQRKHIKQFLLHQGIILIAFVFFLHLVHPYLLTHPLIGMFDMLHSAKQYPWNAAVLFEGNFFQAGVNPLPWYYLIKTIIITTPPFLLILFLLGHLSLLPHFFNRKTKPVKLTLIYIFLTFYIPLLLNSLLSPTLYDSWRHFLFLSVPIIIIASEGLHLILANKKLQISKYKDIPSYLLNPQNRNFTLFAKGVAGILILIAMLYTGIQMIKLHPYEYLYYNFLVDGLKGAYGKYETDYWGLAYKEASIWFNEHINDSSQTYRIFVEGDPLSSTTYFKPNMFLSTNIGESDYIFTFTRWNFHVNHPGKTIHTIEKEGIPLIFIKKL